VDECSVITSEPTSQSARAMCRSRVLRSMRRSVRKIEHSSIDHAISSCDQIRLRVKSDLKFGCSISVINKRRSTTELNPDSRPQHLIVKLNRRLPSRTLRFCGVVPSDESPASPRIKPTISAAKQAQRARFLPDAGFLPAFCFAPDAAASSAGLGAALLRPVECLARLSLARSDTAIAARRTEFISVSGLCPERSALHSDLRLKRFSGSAAAPELPHAPMNSPDAHAPGFLPN
jgi:hypothetical protein